VSDPKHTPGPWNVKNGQIYEDVDGQPWVAGIFGPKGPSIAHVQSYPQGVDGDWIYSNEQAMADAALIASAPDLLSACELAAKYWDGEYNHDQSHVVRALSAAIAKAKGTA